MRFPNIEPQNLEVVRTSVRGDGELAEPSNHERTALRLAQGERVVFEQSEIMIRQSAVHKAKGFRFQVKTDTMKKTVVTGGAGFIGVNLVRELVRKDDSRVVIYDNLSRAGVEKNLAWILAAGGKRVTFVKGDIRDFNGLKKAVKGASEIYHLAAQVAVTTSVERPVEDFEINALGTLYLLEAFRCHAPKALLVYASTNKVYGELLHIPLRKGGKRYHLLKNKNGIGEAENLDFHSPYGNSKGCADQYVRDYHRIYGLKTVVFRQSCIYGPRQFGNEDQGWIAHFIIKGLCGKRLTIYGDGKQVRDLLEVSDLIAAYGAAVKRISHTAGRIYNIGGGLANSFSLLELLDFLKKDGEINPVCDFSAWRPGDQKIFISDNTTVMKDLDWRPKVGKEEGIRRLTGWLREYVAGR